MHKKPIGNEQTDSRWALFYNWQAVSPSPQTFPHPPQQHPDTCAKLPPLILVIVTVDDTFPVVIFTVPFAFLLASLSPVFPTTTTLLEIDDTFLWLTSVLQTFVISILFPPRCLLLPASAGETTRVKATTIKNILTIFFMYFSPPSRSPSLRSGASGRVQFSLSTTNLVYRLFLFLFNIPIFGIILV